jgi:hypothetical protein
MFYLKEEVKQSLYRPWGFQKAEIPRFLSNRNKKVLRLSVYSPATFTPQELFLVLIRVRGWVDSRAIVLPEGLLQSKIPMT